MIQHPIKSQITDDIQAATEQFFSQGSLLEKIDQATALIAMPGHHLFQTALPWQITIGASRLNGISEGLLFAVKDIQSHLVVFRQSYDQGTALEISIDAARFLSPRPQLLPGLNIIELG